MREILFRGKRIDNGEWAEGFYIQNPNPCTEDGLPIRHCIVDLSPFGYDVDPKTVGQFTGLFDRNGNRIFEGDILADPDCPRFTYGAVYYGKASRYTIPVVYGFYSKEYADLEFPEYLEIVGNIHDNPKLLEEMKNE